MRTIRIQKAPKGKEAKYVAVTSDGFPIKAYGKLSDVSKDYRQDVKLGLIDLVRDLDHTYQEGL